jgi:hypothetical protein
MSEYIPRPILQALDQGIEYFVDQNHEWKLEIEQNLEHVRNSVGNSVLVFGNNGYGDFLFLKERSDGHGFEPQAFQFLHEEDEIVPVQENLKTLLGLFPRPPSSDNYPRAKYTSGETIELGDSVKLFSWFQFWKGWQKATVIYVPGVSNLDYRFEYNGIKLVQIENENIEMGCFIDPDTGFVKKLRLIKRASEIND